MHLNEVDSQFLKCIGHLHASDTYQKGDPNPLQLFLEEAIKSKAGVTKDLTALVNATFKQRKIEEFKPVINVVDETRGSSSDNELELDLLKEDLMCVVCNEMDVGARNRLLECSDCHALYHQECHKPIVVIQDSFDSWVCQNCKDVSKKVKSASSTPPSTTPVPTTKSTSKSSSSHRSHSSSYKSGSSSSKSEKSSKSGSKSSKSSSANASSSGNNSRSNVTPNINIISADKRIQIMKKKAAKMQEKRKHLSR